MIRRICLRLNFSPVLLSLFLFVCMIVLCSKHGHGNIIMIVAVLQYWTDQRRARAKSRHFPNLDLGGGVKGLDWV